MKSCIYPGSFDPITLGHLDIIKRTAKQFDKVYVAVLNNSAKKNMFTLEQRMAMVRASVSHLPNVEAIYFEGLLIKLLEKLKTDVIIKGIRTQEDFEYERQMAIANKDLYNNAETILLISDPKFLHISSSIVREFIKYNADISKYVPKEIMAIISEGEKYAST